MRELEDKTLCEHIRSFAHKMHAMREHLAQAGKLYYQLQKQRWFMEAVEIYCDAVNCLAHDLASVDLRARGFLGFRDYIASYAKSGRFASLVAKTETLKADLSSIRYCLRIKGNGVTVSKYEAATDYSADVEQTFEKFKQGAVKDYRVKFRSCTDLNSVEARVLDLVARLYPEIFEDLGHYCARNSAYLDETIGAFDREVQFYVAYLEYVGRLKRAGLQFCYPQITSQDKEVYDYEGFDLALAGQVQDLL